MRACLSGIPSNSASAHRGRKLSSCPAVEGRAGRLVLSSLRFDEQEHFGWRQLLALVPCGACSLGDRLCVFRLALMAGMDQREHLTKAVEEAERELDAAKTLPALDVAAKRSCSVQGQS
jgi:hypothetical protein